MFVCFVCVVLSCVGIDLGLFGLRCVIGWFLGACVCFGVVFMVSLCSMLSLCFV